MAPKLRRALPTLVVLGILAALVALALVLLYVLLAATKGASATLQEAWRLIASEPRSTARIFAGLTIALLLVAGLLTPLALFETRSLRRFQRREEELRRERPGDVATPYEGEEGVGVAFDGPEGRLILLRPVAGIGLPREVFHPAAPVSVASDTMPDPPERPSPVDSSQ